MHWLVGGPTATQGRSWRISATDARCGISYGGSCLTSQRSSPLSGRSTCSGRATFFVTNCVEIIRLKFREVGHVVVFGRPLQWRFALCYGTALLSVCSVDVLWPNGCMDGPRWNELFVECLILTYPTWIWRLQWGDPVLVLRRSSHQNLTY